ncbi:MAG: metalloregulator ArsR/SmtB family transcription factor [archaeon]
MGRTEYTARLRRLLESGLCSSENLQEHIRELRVIVGQIDEEEVKKRSYVLKALADPVRIKMLYLLRERSMCTCEIMSALDLTEPNASHHLNLLERNALVRSEKMGKWVFYELEPKTLRNLAANIAA